VIGIDGVVHLAHAEETGTSDDQGNGSEADGKFTAEFHDGFRRAANAGDALSLRIL
jgi:hypothetical protein